MAHGFTDLRPNWLAQCHSSSFLSYRCSKASRARAPICVQGVRSHASCRMRKSVLRIMRSHSEAALDSFDCAAQLTTARANVYHRPSRGGGSIKLRSLHFIS